MPSSPAPARTAAALQARHRGIDAMLHRVGDALHRMRRERSKITFAAVARRAAVSRTFLYQNPRARTLVQQAGADATAHTVRDHEQRVADVQASWRERALNAEDALKAAHHEVTRQRTTIADLLGKIRDLEQDLPPDGVQRIITDNTTLKQQVRQLNQENRGLQDRLRGARDNARFLDKRVADLEAAIADGALVSGEQQSRPAVKAPAVSETR
ncbi:DUF6262 family protein [Actinoplanes flavus]|uniref:Replication region DNA-binding N-term n=1 Tax=Actinoplanes flavus TaxID=2820290 RepID=A0ABS3UE54_9ACTN|nr:DUF6262 family protein [Actinoplanes flavus]MBO3736721.1 hypothetical protein [Actinoplanes flavus]